METIFADNIRKIKQDKDILEKKLNVSILIVGKKVTINGPTLDEYEASIVFDAISFGYPIKTALLLKEEDMVFRKLSIRDFTRRKDLEVVKSRVIGTKGKTKETIENLTDCSIIVKGNEVGILCSADEMEYIVTAMKNLIRGSKQANIYRFLERINTQKKEIV